MESQPAVAVVYHHIGPYHNFGSLALSTQQGRVACAINGKGIAFGRDLEHFGEASRRIAACFGPDHFVEGLERATKMAIQLTQRDTEQSIGCCDSRQ